MATNAQSKNTEIRDHSDRKTRSYLSQADVPRVGLDHALRIPRAIQEQYALKPTRPLGVAQAMGMQPTSGGFRELCGAAMAYGLTIGGYNAPLIELTQLGRAVVAPTEENSEVLARRTAALKPRVLREFLNRYDGSRLPREDIVNNVLFEMGVPREATKRTYQLILETAKNVGFIKEINGQSYVDLAGSNSLDCAEEPNSQGSENVVQVQHSATLNDPSVEATADGPLNSTTESRWSSNRVFITHGKNRNLVPQLKELLMFGKFEPIVSIERESIAKPVPEKVMDDMRRCVAAIIHVDAERELTSSDGSREVVLNPNVLIEIGAAMALYGRRFVLLVHEDVRLPSNLQGLYQVKYGGEKLDGDSTIRLLKAFNEFKSEGMEG